MLTDITIENYRCFQSYRMDGLARVNLLVGKNNCGKTTLLECIRLLMSGGDFGILLSVPRERGELITNSDGDACEVVSHLFHGHRLQRGSCFRLMDSNKWYPPVEVSIDFYPEDGSLAPLLHDNNWDRVLGLKIESELYTASKRGYLLAPINDSGQIARDVKQMLLARKRSGNGNDPDAPPTVFLTTGWESSTLLPEMWNQVLRAKVEKDVYGFLRVLEPSFVDLVFEVGEGAARYSWGNRSGILVSVGEQEFRIPLGSLGDGMRRMLLLALALNHARGGSLFIDEIDTGFHYSVMPKLWEMVVRTAQETGTQVFATTHSADCVRGLGILCDRHPELQAEVAAHKIDNTLPQSISFSGEDVLNVVEHDIEIR